MQKRLGALVILLALTSGTAKADIVEDMARGNFDLIEYRGHLSTVVRTPHADGTEYIEFKKHSGGEVWYAYSIARVPDGPEKGLVKHLVDVNQHEVLFHFGFDPRGKIISRIEFHSPSREDITITPNSVPCNPLTDARCYWLEPENALVSWFSFGNEGGMVTNWWNVVGVEKPFGTVQKISISSLNYATERMVFVDFEQEWAYPYAGYELKRLPDGKNILFVCRSFANDTCITTD